MGAVKLIEAYTASCRAVITFDGVSMTAMDWAAARGVAWETVKKRRQRGSTWAEALRPGLRASRFNRP